MIIKFIIFENYVFQFLVEHFIFINFTFFFSLINFSFRNLVQEHFLKVHLVSKTEIEFSFYLTNMSLISIFFCFSWTFPILESLNFSIFLFSGNVEAFKSRNEEFESFLQTYKFIKLELDQNFRDFSHKVSEWDWWDFAFYKI